MVLRAPPRQFAALQRERRELYEFEKAVCRDRPIAGSSCGVDLLSFAGYRADEHLCSPFRLITSGSFVLVPPVPTMSGPALLGLTILLLSIGSWVIHRRQTLVGGVRLHAEGGQNA